MPTPFVTVPEAIEEFARGRMVVVVDDEDRENEGDLVLAAEFVTPEAINFMAKYGRGLICLTLTEDRADQMELNPMTHSNTSRFGTAFTESIEAKEGVTTGISAHDRAHTIQVAIHPASTAADLARPGHVFPLRARKGGVLVRAGQTEASVDLARLAGLKPAGVICEIMNDDGTMARVPDLVSFCMTHDLKLLTVEELIRYRLQTERHVRRMAESLLPTKFADFQVVHYQSEIGGEETHTALVLGDIATDEPVPVHVHVHCLAGEAFGSTLCSCRRLLEDSLSAIAQEGRGVVVYLHSAVPNCSAAESRQGTLASQQNEGAKHTVREQYIANQILLDLDVRKIRRLTDRAAHLQPLNEFHVGTVECASLATDPSVSRAVYSHIDAPELLALQQL